jgi:trigger factor
VLEHRDVEFIPEAEKRDPAPGFSETIVGLSPGESKEFTLEVPSDAANAAMAGRTVTFRVTVHGVKEEALPPVDDEFARLVGDFETLDQLRAAVRDELRLHKERALRERLERQVVQQVVDQAEVDLPPQLVEQYARDAEEHVARSLDNQGLTIQQYIKLTGRTTTQFHEELQQQARRSLKRAFVLDAVADAEHIAVSDEEIEAEVRRLVKGEERARQALEREEIRRRIASDLREQKTVARLVDIATEGAGPIASQAASATEAAGSSQEQETDEQQ